MKEREVCLAGLWRTPVGYHPGNFRLSQGPRQGRKGLLKSNFAYFPQYTYLWKEKQTNLHHLLSKHMNLIPFPLNLKHMTSNYILFSTTVFIFENFYNVHIPFTMWGGGRIPFSLVFKGQARSKMAKKVMKWSVGSKKDNLLQKCLPQVGIPLTGESRSHKSRCWSSSLDH